MMTCGMRIGCWQLDILRVMASQLYLTMVSFGESRVEHVCYCVLLLSSCGLCEACWAKGAKSTDVAAVHLNFALYRNERTVARHPT